MRPVAIFGMHRSGTSLVASLVRGLGIDFGPDEAMLASHPVDNPTGYFERRDVSEVNDEILDAMGGTWWRPPRMIRGWQHSPRLQHARSDIEAILRRLQDPSLDLLGPRATGAGARWGIKDPRLALTLPIWEALAGPLDAVVCLRDPAEVIPSLIRRRDREIHQGAIAPMLGPRQWAALWTNYTTAALAHTTPSRRIVIDYGRLMRHGDAELVRIARFLGAYPTRAERGELTRLIDPQLHRARSRDGHPALPRGARLRYRVAALEARRPVHGRRPTGPSAHVPVDPVQSAERLRPARSARPVHEPVSVVIPSYRDSAHVARLVASIRSTTDAELVHVIVSDDASGPAHLAELRQIPETEVVTATTNGGFATNVNRGLRASPPDRDVVVLNSDVICLPGWLEWLQCSARSSDAVAAVGGQLLFGDGRIQWAGTVRDRQWPAGLAHRCRGRPEGYGRAGVAGPVLALTGACMYLTRGGIAAVGLFDEDYPWAFEDVDWCLRAWRVGLRVLYQPRARLIHLEGQVRGPRELARSRESLHTLWERWSAFFDERPVRRGAALRIAYVVDGRPVPEIAAHLDGLRQRGHDVELYSLGAGGSGHCFASVEELLQAIAPLDAIKVATGPATAEAVWMASVVRGRPVLLTKGEELDATAREEFLHVTADEAVHHRLQELGLHSELLPGHEPESLEGLERALRAVATPRIIDLTERLQLADVYLKACRVERDELEHSRSWRLTAPLRHAARLLR